MKKLIYRFAGVDDELIATCPRYDQIWAGHIGIALSLTFLVIFSISFLSIEYINGAAVVLNPDTHTLELAIGNRTPLGVFFTVAAALVIASIVALFDRALFQSDWFSQLPFRSKQGFWDKFWFIAGKIFKTIIRIGMSLALAYVLSTFVELKILESSILTVMQKHHLTENAALYDELKTQVSSLEATGNGQKAIVTQLETDLQKRIAERSLDPSDQKNTLEAQITALQLKVVEAEAAFEKTPNANLAALQTQLTNARKTFDDGASKIRELEKLANAEEAGNPEKLPGVSGIRTCRQRCIYFKKEAASEAKLQEGRAAEITRLEGLISKEGTKSTSEKQAQSQPLLDQIKSLQGKLAELPNKLDATRTKLQDQQIDSLNSELNSRKDDLAADFLLINAKIDALYDRMLKNPAFIPFRDGPLDRLTALEEVKSDPRNANSASQFSMGLKIFIIFLEVVPVISKLFFSPPSVYAIKLQAQAFKQSDEAFSDMKTDGLDGDFIIEKKKIELQEIIRQRLMAEQATHEYRHAFDKTRSSNTSKQATA